MLQTLSHAVSYHFLPYIHPVWGHTFQYPLLAGMPPDQPMSIISVFPSPTPFSAQYTAGAQRQQVLSEGSLN